MHKATSKVESFLKRMSAERSSNRYKKMVNEHEDRNITSSSSSSPPSSPPSSSVTQDVMTSGEEKTDNIVCGSRLQIRRGAVAEHDLKKDIEIAKTNVFKTAMMDLNLI